MPGLDDMDDPAPPSQQQHDENDSEGSMPGQCESVHRVVLTDHRMRCSVTPMFRGRLRGSGEPRACEVARDLHVRVGAYLSACCASPPTVMTFQNLGAAGYCTRAAFAAGARGRLTRRARNGNGASA